MHRSAAPPVSAASHPVAQADAVGSVRCVRFYADPGLHEFSAVFDGSRFDWESLYVTLNQWSNQGERTGPWDFSPIDGARPVVPAWWVELDGQRLGLWYCQRVSLEDLAAKRFRGRVAFWIREAGTHELRFEPYKPAAVDWMWSQVRPDVEDTLLPSTAGIRTAEHSPLAAWAREEFWAARRRELATTHALYAKPLSELFDQVIGRWVQRLAQHPEESPPSAEQPMVGRDILSHDILVLVAAHHLEHRLEALDLAKRVLDVYVRLPYWGNPHPDGYGHDGDMFAADTFRVLAFASHALGPYLDENQTRELLAKLRYQGDRFLTLALLTRDYWGGSLLQDHGRQSLLGFATGALHLLGMIPQAEQWVRYAMPRIDRAQQALPRDGVISHSSYHSTSLYLDEMAFYREAVLAQCGRDIYDEAPLHAIIDYLEQSTFEGGRVPVWGVTTDSIQLRDGQMFFNQIAAKYQDGRAARVQRILLGRPLVAEGHPMDLRACSMDRLWSFFSYDPRVEPRSFRRPVRRLIHRADSAVAQYFDDERQLALSLHCGPWIGYHAWRHASGPCDRLEMVPDPGHFNLMVGGEPILCTPPGGYKMCSTMRNCMLVDDHGPHGDIGYPMSLPAWRYRGEEIEAAHWDEPSGRGVIQLNLQPAYTEQSGIICYTRRFTIESPTRIILQDDVLLEGPRWLSWNFHGRRGRVHLIDGQRCRFGSDVSAAILTPEIPGSAEAKIEPTHEVRSYTAQWGFAEHEHVCYRTSERTRGLSARFVFDIETKG